MPLIILKDSLEDLKIQLDQEEDFLTYTAIKDRVNNRMIKDIIADTISIEGILDLEFDLIASKIKKEILAEEVDEDFKSIHNLSKEQKNRIFSIIQNIEEVDLEEIDYFNQVDSLTKEIALKRGKLNNALIDETNRNYIEEMQELNIKINSSNSELGNLILKKESLAEVEIKISNDLRRAKEKVELLKRPDNVKDLSNKLINGLEELISTITFKQKIKVENYFNLIFSEIIRKEKFIDFISLDEDFKINLYVKKTYTREEIRRMILNLGREETRKKFGDLFMEGIYAYCNTEDKGELLVCLNKGNEEDKIVLDTKIDLMNLFSGEKQVYVLCLYWALIKSSGIEIPFIIDTPYGRIDEKHRQAITNKFFPKISEQVIIFSTNTEIEEGLYEDINKYLAKEYRLEYDVGQRKTKVHEGYFYEVI